MATAKKNIIPPVPVIPQFTVTLELNEDEAKTLRDILYLVGGDPQTSRRRYAQSVERALAGVLGSPDGRFSDVSTTGRLIWFLWST